MTGAARAKPAEALLPAEDCDLLSGRDAIARWFGLTCGQCDARIRDGSIVTFKLPNRSTTYALKYENMRSWKAAAESYRARNEAGSHSSSWRPYSFSFDDDGGRPSFGRGGFTLIDVRGSTAS